MPESVREEGEWHVSSCNASVVEAEVAGLMDDVCAVACPKAMAVVVPKLAARLQADGAKLEPSKSKWTTLGGKKTRELIHAQPTMEGVEWLVGRVDEARTYNSHAVIFTSICCC